MNRALRLLLLTFVFVFMEFSNANRLTNTTLINAETYGLMRAAHDASLQVDPVLLAEGAVVFDRERARAAFEYALRRNMRLDATLHPEAGSYLQHPLEIVFEEYIDDASGVTFPYNYRNDSFKIYKTLDGPSLVYEVRMRSPRMSQFDYDGYIYKNIVQLYPQPR